MNTDYFLEFATLAELESYVDAAERLSLSESSLSRHIKALEEELSVPLFKRTSRTVKLNEYGKIFLPFARQFLELQKLYMSQLESARLHNESKVIICSAYYVDDLLSLFHKQHKGIGIISLNTAENFHDIMNLLRRNVCELAFIIDPEELDELEIIPYESDYHIAVLPCSHPLADRQSIFLNELANENFISFKKNSYSDNQLHQLCKKAGFSPRIIFSADVGSAIASFVRSGMGVSVLLKKNISKRKIPDIALVDLKPEAKIDIKLCYLKNAKLSPGAKDLIRFVKETWPTLKDI